MRTNSKVWLSCIAAFVIAGVVFGGQGQKTARPAPPAATPTPIHSPTPPTGVTMAMYRSLKPGMGYAEVVKVIGEGEERSSNNIAGADTVLYAWPGEAWGSSMNAIFQNGKLVQKSQSGLR